MLLYELKAIPLEHKDQNFLCPMQDLYIVLFFVSLSGSHTHILGPYKPTTLNT